MFYFYLKVIIVIIETITNFNIVNWHFNQYYKYIMLFLSLIIINNEIKKLCDKKMTENKNYFTL